MTATTVYEKIEKLKTIKDDLKTNIESYGVTVGTAPFDEYPAKVLEIPTTDSIKTLIDAVNEESGGATTQDSIDLIDSNYTDIKAAITAAGVDMAGVKPSGYDIQIAKVGDTYTRPSFWPELPTIAVDENNIPTEQVIYLLVAVFPEESTRLEFYQIAGNTTIDWGDGVIENHTTAVQSIRHVFDDYASIPGVENERGYKTAIVKIKPQAGQQLTYIYVLSSFFSTVLEAIVALSQSDYLPQLVMFSHQPMLETGEILGKVYGVQYHGVTRGGFSSCPRLQRIVFDSSRNREGRWIYGFQSVIPDNISFKNITDYLGSACYGVNDNKAITVESPIASVSAPYIFYSTGLRSIEFDTCDKFTVFTSAFDYSTNLVNLKVPGIKVSFGCVSTSLSFSQLKRIIENDLGIPATTATLTITGTPDATAVIDAITAGTIVVPAGWTVAN